MLKRVVGKVSDDGVILAESKEVAGVVEIVTEVKEKLG
jgi:hypothetical protein